MTRPRTASTMLTAAAIVVATTITGCSSAHTNTTEKPAATTTGDTATVDHPEAAAFPVTITHKFGETTITAAPKRVVSVGYNDGDALVALGVVPVAVRDWDGMSDDGFGPWADAYVKGHSVELLKDKTLNAEKIAALKPDLIIATYSGIDKQQYEALSAIAPVVAQKADYPDYQQPWDVTTEEIGQAVGKQKLAKQLVANVKEKFTQLKSTHPQWEGKTLTVATYDGKDLSAFASGDPRARFFTNLGFMPNTAIDTAAGDKFCASLSLEKADMLNSDVIVWDQLSYAKQGKATITDDKVIGKLPAVTGDHSVYLEGELEKAFGWQTVLSLGYVLDHIAGPLDAAVAGRG